MRIGISGASGFIGRNLVNELEKSFPGHEIITIGRSSVGRNYRNIFWDFDSEKVNSISGNNFDLFFHLGWSGIPEYDSKIQLEQLESHKELINQLYSDGTKRMFVSGTCFEYGRIEGAVKESDDCLPESLYAKSKVKLLSHIKEICDSSGGSFVWGRIFYVYGENQPSHTLLGSLINASINTKSFHISKPEKVVDYLNIEALSKLILNITLLTSFSGVVNLGSGKPITVASQTRHWIEDLNLDLKITESVGNAASEGFWSDRSLLDSVLSVIEES